MPAAPLALLILALFASLGACTPFSQCLIQNPTRTLKMPQQIVGCFDIPDIIFPSNHSALPVTSADEIPTLNESVACVTNCLLQGFSTWVTQFGFKDHQCFCLDSSDFKPLPAKPITIIPQCYDPGVLLLQVSLSCPFTSDANQCNQFSTETFCEMDDGCCVARDSNLPPGYASLTRWVTIVIIVLMVLEAIIYACCWNKRVRRQFVATGEEQDGHNLRDQGEACELSQKLLSGFPELSLTNNTPLFRQEDAEQNCVICLEALGSKKSVVLPCHHALHASCMEEYMTHQLTTKDEVLCPMCRDAIRVEPNYV